MIGWKPALAPLGLTISGKFLPEKNTQNNTSIYFTETIVAEDRDTFATEPAREKRCPSSCPRLLFVCYLNSVTWLSTPLLEWAFLSETAGLGQ
jgi:hypothetical protein